MEVRAGAPGLVTAHVLPPSELRNSTRLPRSSSVPPTAMTLSASNAATAHITLALQPAQLESGADGEGRKPGSEGPKTLTVTSATTHTMNAAAANAERRVGRKDRGSSKCADCGEAPHTGKRP